MHLLTEAERTLPVWRENRPLASRAGGGGWGQGTRSGQGPPPSLSSPAPRAGPPGPCRGHRAGTSDSSGRKGDAEQEGDRHLRHHSFPRQLCAGPAARAQEPSSSPPRAEREPDTAASRAAPGPLPEAPGPRPLLCTVPRRPQSRATCLPQSHLTPAAPGRAWREEGNQGQKQGSGVSLGLLFLSTGYSCPGDDKPLIVSSKSAPGIRPGIGRNKQCAECGHGSPLEHRHPRSRGSAAAGPGWGDSPPSGHASFQSTQTLQPRSSASGDAPGARLDT
ncbi:unnamed protein product [Gulo gulo]|uniref:Uncharacterized protein n=1 Tax=Gulo gulo TaxID=48420 RepID=A0A9X9PTN3_GULGU|nr:unnamed protein product [Gulo gulo]